MSHVINKVIFNNRKLLLILNDINGIRKSADDNQQEQRRNAEGCPHGTQQKAFLIWKNNTQIKWISKKVIWKKPGLINRSSQLILRSCTAKIFYQAAEVIKNTEFNICIDKHFI